MSVLKRIKVWDVKVGMIIVRCDKAGVPFNEYGVPLTDISKAQKLASYGVENVYVWIGEPSKTVMAPKKNLPKEHTYDVPKDDDIKSIDIAAAGELANRVKTAIEKALDDIKKGRIANIDTLNVMVSDVIHTAIDTPGIFTSIPPFKAGFNEEDCTHSLNVCLLAVSIGQIMGLKGKELADLGLAAILHDVGSMRVPERILTKKTALSEMEFAVLKKHPTWGHEILSRNSQINNEVLLAVSPHHEYCNGSGYPSALKEIYLTRISKILSVAEDYETMINGRMASYRASNNTDAIKRIYAGIGKQYNEAVVKAFVSVVGVFPVGTTVKLTDGNVAVICEVNKKDQSKPKVILLGKDGKGERSFVNLAKSPTIKVAATINHAEYGINPDDILHGFFNDRLKSHISNS
ncbi:MAG: HD domain-containing protein [Deferribacterales bacterium]|nr:HD domain-containing protein [Deferribacterales bacterium]